MTATSAAKAQRLVLLAAGASSRLGQPKALAPLPQGTPLERLLRAMHWAQVSSEAPLLITGRHDAEIRAALCGLPAVEQPNCHFNPDWATGRTTSILTAARHATDRDLLIAPVDHPRISSRLLHALCAEWQQRGAPARGWLAPGSALADPPNKLRKSSSTDAGTLRAGHPIVVGRDLIAVLLSAAASWSTRPLRDLRALADPLWMWPVLDTLDALAIHENLDTPADLAALTRRDAVPSD